MPPRADIDPASADEIIQALSIALRAAEVRYVSGIPEDAIEAVAGELLDAIMPALWHWKQARRLASGAGSLRD